MEIKFELATEPAVKALIAIGAFAGITTTITYSPNVYGISAGALTAGLALIIGAHRMPPLCACA